MNKKSLFFLLLLICIIYFLQSQFFRLHSTEKLSTVKRDILVKEAAVALKSEDVPVGALLLYNDTILSTGYNTVLRDSNAGGHAEINAISNAVRQIGFSSFSKLDRKKLILVSTFEPCMMCRGAIIEYNIRHVYFLKGKGLFHWLKNDAKQLRYEWNTSQAEGKELQDSLFLLHPKYKR